MDRLTHEYRRTSYPSTATKASIARDLGLRTKQVSWNFYFFNKKKTNLQVHDWFKNRRQRNRNRDGLLELGGSPEPQPRPRQLYPKQPAQLPYQAPGGSRPDWWYCKICVSSDPSNLRSALIPCGHVVCSECANMIMRANNECPCCRGRIDAVFKMYE